MTVPSDIHQGMTTAPARDLPVGESDAGGGRRTCCPGEGCRSAGRRRVAALSRGCWSMSRWPIWTGRTTTWLPSRTPRLLSREPGSGCASPAGWSAATCWNGSRSPTTRAGWASSSGWCRPSRCCPPEVAQLARAVADRYAGSAADVLRLAVPPRHAKVEGRAGQPAAADAHVGRPGPDGVMHRAWRAGCAWDAGCAWCAG